MEPSELESIARAARRRPLWTPNDSSVSTELGYEAISRLLPHRAPFLFVDKIVRVDLTQRAIETERTIAIDDPVFRGHFPNQPVYPGVLLIETAGQAGLCIAALVRAGRISPAEDATPEDVRALKVHSTSFLASVSPGDKLGVSAMLLEMDDTTALCAGQIRRGSDVCVVTMMEVYFVEA